MKIKLSLLAFLGLSLAYQQCLAQSGYNYARPEVTNVANIATAAAGGRSIGGSTFPTGGPTATATFPTTATTGYGGPAAGTGALNPTTAVSYGGYAGQGQPQRIGSTTITGFTPSVPGLTSPTAAASFPGGSTAGLPKQRPTSTLQQRTGGSIYTGPGVSNVGGTQSTQFSSTSRGGAGGGRGQGRSDLGTDYDDEAGDYSAIPGVPSIDYPIYSQVPPTNFDCAQQLPGYYSDVEAQCQVFHICAMNRTYSFLCPNGTVFSQDTLVCVWWNQFDCGTAPSLYGNNAYIYDYGNERTPTLQQNAFQNAQIGVGGGGGGGPTRQQQQQSSYAQANTGGSRTTASTVTGTSIYGGGNIRTTVGGNNFPNVATSVTPVPTSNFQNTVAGIQNTGRFMPSTTATAQKFNAAAAVATPAPFGSVIRGGVGGGVGGSGGTPYPQSGQIASTSANREYLPPRRP